MSGPKHPIPIPPSADPSLSAASARPPAVAGRFYPAIPAECRALAAQYVDRAALPDDIATTRWVGGIVPHAGWICSAALAGQTLAALARTNPNPPDVVIIFAAVHTPISQERAALGSWSHWLIPCGQVEVHVPLATALLAAHPDLFAVDDRFHIQDHAVEVELPLVQHAWPTAAILPVEVPSIELAAEVGRQTARQVQALGLRALYLASSDLTHYGPAYDFTPDGVGSEALAWAKENDRRLLSLACELAVDRIVPEAAAHLNACGAGAIAAMLAAVRLPGASRGRVLHHANSCETLAATHPQPPINAVGYASVVIG